MVDALVSTITFETPYRYKKRKIKLRWPDKENSLTLVCPLIKYNMSRVRVILGTVQLMLPKILLKKVPRLC